VSDLAIVNRRETYRYSPPPVLTPRLAVINDGQRVFAERIKDINSRGARIEFPLDLAPSLRPGSEVTVSGFAPGLDGCVDIPARVVFSAVKETAGSSSRVVVGLLFKTLPDVADRADGAFFEVFNRRATRRAQDAV